MHSYLSHVDCFEINFFEPAGDPETVKQVVMKKIFLSVDVLISFMISGIVCQQIAAGDSPHRRIGLYSAYEFYKLFRYITRIQINNDKI